MRYIYRVTLSHSTISVYGSNFMEYKPATYSGHEHKFAHTFAPTFLNSWLYAPACNLSATTPTLTPISVSKRTPTLGSFSPIIPSVPDKPYHAVKKFCLSKARIWQLKIVINKRSSQVAFYIYVYSGTSYTYDKLP